VFNTMKSDKRWLCNVSKFNTVCCTRIRKGPYNLQIQNQYMTAEIYIPQHYEYCHRLSRHLQTRGGGNSEENIAN